MQNTEEYGRCFRYKMKKDAIVKDSQLKICYNNYDTKLGVKVILLGKGTQL